MELTIKEKLIASDIKPSYIRLRILEYLSSVYSHPTADEIYSALLGEIPTLSKTTVYNTMKLLAKVGLIKVITIDEEEVRFDADISLHGHFRCEKCKKVYDFLIDKLEINDEKLKNWKVTSKEVYYIGVCDCCQNLK